MAERIPPLTPVRPREIVRYEEIKRLAELRWAHPLEADGHRNGRDLAAECWNEAEAMHAESERRRPKE